MYCVVCTDLNYAIGRGNELLYHISEDLRRFRALTLGKAIIMGRTTLETMPGKKPLPKRDNIILSRDSELSIYGAVVLHSEEELLEYLRSRYKSDDVAVIGGESVYGQLLQYCDTVYLTMVEDEFFGADKFFPRISELAEWSLVEESDEMSDGNKKYRYLTYKKS